MTSKLIEREHFQSEIDFLSGISKQSTLYISQFNLFIDENGLLRCRTRLQNAATEFDTKNPILLPARNLFSKLVVLQCHKKFYTTEQEKLYADSGNVFGYQNHVN